MVCNFIHFNFVRIKELEELNYNKLLKILFVNLSVYQYNIKAHYFIFLQHILLHIVIINSIKIYCDIKVLYIYIFFLFIGMGK